MLIAPTVPIFRVSPVPIFTAPPLPYTPIEFPVVELEFTVALANVPPLAKYIPTVLSPSDVYVPSVKVLTPLT